MFHSFYPKPRILFLSFLIWGGGAELGRFIGLTLLPEDTPPIVGLHYFWTPDFLWFYIYYWVCAFLFAAFWFKWSPHKWQMWSILGSALIIFNAYFSVQVSVALNNWRRPYGDAIQNALTNPGSVTLEEFYGLAFIFFYIVSLFILVAVANIFFTKHYVFRWRTAMNDFYVGKWDQLRHIEGASQRVQEDTMRFARKGEEVGINALDAILTLFAFTPVLIELSVHVTELPIVGKIPAPLLWAALMWCFLGTVILAIVGMKLPGLEFNNQKVEAAYRKELVYGEDDDDRAKPLTLKELFFDVRRNYFRLFFHYAYFDTFRYFYLQTNVIFPALILAPTIIAGAITFGIYQQIRAAFDQVTVSFQYLIRVWPDIVELMSIYKRLQAFEATLSGGNLPKEDQDYFSGTTSAPDAFFSHGIYGQTCVRNFLIAIDAIAIVAIFHPAFRHINASEV